MASNKQLNYNYIANTLNKTTTKQYDGSLGIGISVQNLALPLTEDSIINPNFLDIYDDKPLTEAWKVGQEQQTVSFSQTYTTTSYQDGIYIQTQQHVSGTTGRFAQAEGPYSNRAAIAGKYPVSGSITVPAGTRNVTIFPATNTVSQNGTTVSYTLYGQRASQFVTGIINYEYPIRQYVHTTTHKIDSSISDSDIKISVSNGSYSQTRSGDTLTINWTGEGGSYKLTLSYPGPKSEFTQEDTLLNGVLQHQVKLKNNTSYVLQIVGASPLYKKVGGVYPKSKIESISTGDKWEFDQYLFFKTKNNDDLDFIISAYGVSFGYSVYGKMSTGTEIIQLRCIEPSIQSKVFLFESDAPWKVDKNGVITGVAESVLQIKDECQVSGYTGVFSKEEIKKIFSKTPELVVGNSGNSITVLFPDSNGTKWKWETLIKQTAQQSENSLEDVDLYVYRNFLSSTTRLYNKKNYIIDKSKVWSIQKTKTSTSDTYSSGAKISDFKIKVQLNMQNIDWSKATANGVSFLWTPSNGQRIISGTQDDNIDFSLPLASLLGYNREYSLEKNLPKEYMYKYTTISFAWGDSENMYSDLSMPIFIDRSVIYNWDYKDKSTKKIEDGDWFKLYFNNCVISKKTNTEFYTGEAIYIDPVE